MKRMIHAEIWSSDQVSKLSISARLLYIGMITIADDDGRLKGNSAYLRSQIFPYDETITTENVKQWLSEIKATGLIDIYRVGESWYIYHPNWSKYQKLRGDRKKQSMIPEPNGNQMSAEWQPSGGLSAAEGKVRQVKLSKGKVIAAAAAGVTELIKEFEKFNPTADTWYNNKTQRGALQYLLDKYGFEECIKLIASLPSITSMKYAPKVTTPYELKRDLAKLQIFLSQENQIKTKKIASV